MVRPLPRPARPPGRAAGLPPVPQDRQVVQPRDPPAQGALPPADQPRQRRALRRDRRRDPRRRPDLAPARPLRAEGPGAVGADRQVVTTRRHGQRSSTGIDQPGTAGSADAVSPRRKIDRRSPGLRPGTNGPRPRRTGRRPRRRASRRRSNRPASWPSPVRRQGRNRLSLRTSTAKTGAPWTNFIVSGAEVRGGVGAERLPAGQVDEERDVVRDGVAAPCVRRRCSAKARVDLAGRQIHGDPP